MDLDGWMDLEKSSKKSLSLCAEKISATKTVVSSAYCDSLISLESTSMPYISFDFLIAFPRSSIAKTNNKPDKGQP